MLWIYTVSNVAITISNLDMGKSCYGLHRVKCCHNMKLTHSQEVKVQFQFYVCVVFSELLNIHNYKIHVHQI